MRYVNIEVIDEIGAVNQLTEFHPIKLAKSQMPGLATLPINLRENGNDSKIETALSTKSNDLSTGVSSSPILKKIFLTPDARIVKPKTKL